MNEKKWLACGAPAVRLEFLRERASKRKIQLFLCACCRRVYGPLTDATQQISQMMTHLRPEPGVVLGDVCDVFQQAIDIAERFADRLATAKECKKIAKAAENIGRHFGFIAAVAPSPGDDSDYDKGRGAVMMGGDAMDAADLAVLNEPNALEHAVRVAASAVVYDIEAYHAGAEGADSDFAVAPNHPHLVARRAESAAQLQLLDDVFGNPFRNVRLNRKWLTSTVVTLARQMYDSRDFGAMPILADALQDAGCNSADILDHCCGPGSHVRGCWVVDLVLEKV
jgi:hypothetical protein